MQLNLLDLGDERTMSVAIHSVDPSQPSQLEEQVGEVMRVIESFEFHPPMPYDLGTPR